MKTGPGSPGGPEDRSLLLDRFAMVEWRSWRSIAALLAVADVFVYRLASRTEEMTSTTNARMHKQWIDTVED
jgi:hypothetical protein